MMSSSRTPLLHSGENNRTERGVGGCANLPDGVDRISAHVAVAVLADAEAPAGPTTESSTDVGNFLLDGRLQDFSNRKRG